MAYGMSRPVHGRQAGRQTRWRLLCALGCAGESIARSGCGPPVRGGTAAPVPHRSGSCLSPLTPAGTRVVAMFCTAVACPLPLIPHLLVSAFAVHVSASRMCCIPRSGVSVLAHARERTLLPRGPCCCGA